MAHLDQFHFGSASRSAQFAAWLWVGVYVTVPPTLAAVGWYHHRSSGSQPATAPMSSGIRVGMLVVSVVGMGVGIVMFVASGWVDRWWPWPLTALAGRAVASGFLGFGAGSAYVVFHGDWRRGLLAFPSFAALGGLQLAAGVRYRNDIDWSRPASALYVAFFLLVALLGLIASNRAFLRKAE